MTFPDGRHHAAHVPRISEVDRDHMGRYLTTEGYELPNAGYVPQPRRGDPVPARPAPAEWMAPTVTQPPAAGPAQHAQFWDPQARTPQHQGEFLLDEDAQKRREEAERLDRAGLPFVARGRSVDRLINIGAGHAGHAADRVRTKDDISAHSLAQFSVDLRDESYPLSVATKLSFSDEQNEDLLRVLDSMTRYVDDMTANARRAGERYDPRIPVISGTGMANRSEERPRSMTYVGVGVSTLDTPEMSWAQMKKSVERYSGLHLRSQGYLYLADGTLVHFVRAAQYGPQAGQHEIVANRTVHSSRYRVRRNFDLWTTADPYARQVWQGLQGLDQALTAAIEQ